MNLEEAKDFLENKIKENNSIIKEARKNRDINQMELTADLDTENTAIKALLEENEFLRLKGRNRSLGRYGEVEVHDLINEVLKRDYIPRTAVEEKIKELRKLLEKYRISREYGQMDITLYKIHILGELLKENEK